MRAHARRNMHAHMHAAEAHIAPPLWRLWQAWVRDFHTVAMPSTHAYTEHFRFNRPGYAKCCTMKARAAKVLASTHNTAQSDSSVQGTAPVSRPVLWSERCRQALQQDRMCSHAPMHPRGRGHRPHARHGTAHRASAVPVGRPVGHICLLALQGCTPAGLTHALHPKLPVSAVLVQMWQG